MNYINKEKRNDKILNFAFTKKNPVDKMNSEIMHCMESFSSFLYYAFLSPFRIILSPGVGQGFMVKGNFLRKVSNGILFSL